MLFAKIAVVFVMVSVAAAEFIPRTPAIPGGCKAGYRLKRKCGCDDKDEPELCCPRKSGIEIGIGSKNDDCIPPEPE
ncbi:hypothetical protein BGZ93_003587, partial [Podila epicladia]